jgi:hypothetical protein
MSRSNQEHGSAHRLSYSLYLWQQLFLTPKQQSFVEVSVKFPRRFLLRDRLLLYRRAPSQNLPPAHSPNGYRTLLMING